MKGISLLFSSIICWGFGSYAQNKTPASILWRISGNGLAKPSYLMGTMHVRNENLFYFTDSVYAAIEQVQLFATEIDDDRFLEFQAKKIIDESLKDTDAVEKTGEETAINQQPAQQQKKDKQLVTDEKLKIRDYIGLLQSGYLKRKNGTNKLMPFIIDSYLNNIARNQGKIITGLEDPEDFEGWSEERNKDISPIMLLKLGNGAMEDFYAKGDIQQIVDFMQ